GEIEAGGRKSLAWWKDIVSVKTWSFTGIYNWFDNFLFRDVGNGDESLFWDDPWFGEGIILRKCFPCLASLFLESGITVGEVCRRG
ncbi:palmitoyl-monogalactosyldiacylglycerol delta-7 desaturase, partial [Trifolium medium]|nr:palmitoyl-monogalactosyldiacylglycerol delta-7 desaturase [Trifolium medium]